MRVKYSIKSVRNHTLYDNIPFEINGLLGLETGHINIGMSAVMDMQQFIYILGEFHKLYPNVRII